MYKKIGLAIAFSPRIEALIAEAKRLVLLFDAELLLIHIGVKTPELEGKLNEILRNQGLDQSNVTVFWKQGKPVKMLLQTCRDQSVDLLVLGALKKEGLLTYYLGSVARKIIRKAPCSVLTLISPKIEGEGFSKVVINGTQLEVTPKVIELGLDFCKIAGVQQVHILNEIKLYGLQMATAGEGSEEEVANTRRKLVQDEIEYVQQILNGLEKGNLRINIKVTAGKWSIELAKYCEMIQADLLIMGDNKDYSFIDRIFPHELENILENLPTNFLYIK